MRPSAETPHETRVAVGRQELEIAKRAWTEAPDEVDHLVTLDPEERRKYLRREKRLHSYAWVLILLEHACRRKARRPEASRVLLEAALQLLQRLPVHSPEGLEGLKLGIL